MPKEVKYEQVNRGKRRRKDFFKIGDEKVKKLNHKKSFGYLSKIEKKIIMAFVKELREKFGEEIISIRLFGSKVRGDFTQDSDIDILLVFQVKSIKVRDKVYDILFDIDPDYALKISPRIMSL